MQNLSVRNHYNPCFWTAHWNPEYFKTVRDNLPRSRARDQLVHVLSVKSNTLFHATCTNVHYDEHIGIAEITFETAEDFCRRRHPRLHKDFKDNHKAEDYPVWIEFEDLFRGMEGLKPYKTLVNVIKSNCISGATIKVEIAHFVVWQILRSHAVMSSMLEFGKKTGTQKFELLLDLKWMLADASFMAKALIPLSESRWRLFHVERDSFPLTDSAILVEPDNIMVALSPRHLLMIERNVKDYSCWHHKMISPELLAEFRRRTIGNTFREMIFSDPRVLEEWRADPAFQTRVEFIKNMKNYDAVSGLFGDPDSWDLKALVNR